MMILHTKNMRRGTVLLLVVSVLALLAVMGTAYLVSSRTERSSSRAGTDATMMNLAQDGLVNQIKQKLGDEVPVVTTWWETAKSYKVGDQVISPFGTGVIHTCMKDHTSDPSDTSKPAPFWTGVSGSTWSGMHNGYDYPSTKSLLVSKVYYNKTDAFPVSQAFIPRFNPSNGNYDLPSTVPDPTNILSDGSTADVGANVVGNPTAVGNYADSYYYLLPYSSSNGVRYRYGIRVIDTNSMANLNTGWPGTAVDPAGQYLSGVSLPSAVSGAFPDTAVDLQTAGSGLGRKGTSSTAYTVDQWHNQLMHIEKPTDPLISFFDLSDELELRSFGTYGTTTPLRSGAKSSPTVMTWPVTLAQGSTYRQNFTTFSFDREMRRFADISPVTPYKFAGETVWPVFPAKAPINIASKIDSATNILAFATEAQKLGHVATNLVTAREIAGKLAQTYRADPELWGQTQMEARQFAVNYLTYRYTGSPTGDYKLPNGPSFMDEKGICIRGSDLQATPQVFKADLNLPTEVAAPANCVYLGYAAQPFINEISANVKRVPGPLNDGTDDTAEVTGSAVELYNPYNRDLSLDGFQLLVDGGTVISLTGYKIPALGFAVVVTDTTIFTTDPSATVIDKYSSNNAPITTILAADATLVKQVILQRQYVDRSNVVQAAMVDVFDCAALVVLDTDVVAAGSLFTIERKRTGSSYAVTDPLYRNWGCVFEEPATRARTATPNLGLASSTFWTNADNEYYVAPLFDRFADEDFIAAGGPQVQGSQLRDIQRFARIMRVGNYFDGTNWHPITTTLTAIYTAAASPQPYGNINFSVFPKQSLDAQVHYDFRAPVDFYNNSTTAATADYDSKAIYFLDSLAWIDRVSDASIDVGQLKAIDKLRLPGRINLNTASTDVLQTLPNMTLARATIIDTQRKASFGIRSQGQLLAELIAGNTSAYTACPNLDAMYEVDKWGSLYTATTVRSDTFVVYGYLEAIKARDPATHNNGSDWYQAADNTGTQPNTLLAKRRFMMIVDRSWCNYPRSDTVNFKLPRVVAFKEMPN